jgi:hypothetical protein
MVSGARQAIVAGFIAVLLMILPGNLTKAESHTPGVCQQAYGSLDPLDTLPDWLQTDVTGEDLHTANRYDLLAGRLLFSGFVDGSQCAGWGLNVDGSPNGCGVALSEPPGFPNRGQNQHRPWPHRTLTTVSLLPGEIHCLYISQVFRLESTFTFLRKRQVVRTEQRYAMA